MVTPVEIKIPVPWGHIAGKSWGDNSSEKILAVHGRQENCATFSRLIPILQGSFFIVAIDLPGHGFSSHFPPGLPVNFIDYVIAIKKVIDHMQWNSFNIIGHSVGADMAMYYAAMFPQEVKKLLIIDHFGPECQPDSEIIDFARKQLLMFLNIEKLGSTGKPPVYSYEEALKKISDRRSPLSKEAAELLLERCLVPVEKGYTFSMDQRIKVHPFPTLISDVWKMVLEHIRCPTFLIVCTESMEYHENMFPNIIPVFKSQKNLKMTILEANHDVHQNEPEKIAPFVDKFFLSSKL